MSKLLGQAKSRRTGLQKAKDDGLDPAEVRMHEDDSSNASVSASQNDSGNAATLEAQETTSTRAPKKTASATKPRRRIGRPRGPERVATTIRLLGELDEQLTRACNDTESGPQDVLEAALAEWLLQRGYLTKKGLSLEVATAISRVAR